MARSYRHTPIIGHCSHSDKPGKIQFHRAMRAAERHALVNCTDYEELIMPAVREVSNVWSFPKDGKFYMGRKYRDKRWYVKAMRK
nr:hypothetical protein Hi04_10k_c2089_00027 [uncultured bacterium]